MSALNEFTNKYQLSKTLKFELIPQGKTHDNINKKGLIVQDEERANDYKIAKKIIDEYHKDFIEKSLTGFSINGLDDYYFLYKIIIKDETQKTQFDNVHIDLRKQIAERFSKHPDANIKSRFKNLFAKELIKVDLLNFVTDTDELAVIKGFENFTTYFTGFNDNRKNMYSAEDKSTAIAYRLINQNLPKFIDNARTFEKISASPVAGNFDVLLNELQSIVQVNNVAELFDLNYFNETLTQKGIDIYNTLIGGFTAEDEKTKFKGLNEYINLYNQTVKREEKIGRLKPLFKQILSDRSSASFSIEEFKNDAEVFDNIERLYTILSQEVFDFVDDEVLSLSELLSLIDKYDLSKIYLKNDLGLTDISQKMFGSWSILQNAVYADFDSIYKGKIKKGTEKYEEEQAKYFKRHDSFSIQYLNDSLKLLSNKDYHISIDNYFKQLGNYKQANDITLFESVKAYYAELSPKIKNYADGNNLKNDQPTIDKLKLFLDSIKAIQHFIKPLLGKGNEANKDDKFYGDFDKLWNTLDQITPLYNKVRNYVTGKPYSTEKIKLNFENPNLLDGWPVDREIATSSLLFKEDDKFYLGILSKADKKNFKNIPKPIDCRDVFYKMNYLQAADPSKDVQNLMMIDGITVKKNGRKEKEGENQG